MSGHGLRPSDADHDQSVMAVKTLTVKSWEHICTKCDTSFDVEEAEARMAPDVPLYVAPDEKPYSVLD